MSSKHINSNHTPKKVNGQMALMTEFYRRFLFRKVKGIFSVKVPDEWDYDYTLDSLLSRGYITVTDSPIGVQAFVCSTYGINYRNQPTNVRVAVPQLKGFDRTIGIDCELLYLARRFGSVYFTYTDLIDIYAQRLASCDAAVDVNILNSRVAFVMEADSKAQAETLYALFDTIMDGEPAVVVRSGTLDQKSLNVFFNSVKNNFVADVLLDAKRTIMNEFLTEIGVNNANTDKRERLVTSEVAANNQELMLNTDVIATNLEICMDKIHRMFPELKSSFTVELKYRKELMEQNDSEQRNSDMGNKESDSETVRRNETA